MRRAAPRARLIHRLEQRQTRGHGLDFGIYNLSMTQVAGLLASKAIPASFSTPIYPYGMCATSSTLTLALALAELAARSVYRSVHLCLRQALLVLFNIAV